MSADYPYIDIAVRYDHGGSMVTMFTSPQGAAARIPSVDGRNIASKFVNFTTGYVISERGDKRMFTLLDVADPSSPAMAVTISVDKDVILSGRMIVKLLESLKHQLGESGTLSEPTVNHILRNLGFSISPLRKSTTTPRSTSEYALCYRTYLNGTELDRILSFPCQPEYARYSDIVVVPATVVSSDNSLTRISGLPKELLAVICPAGVRAAVAEIPADSKLKITYQRPYFRETTVEFIPDEPNCYAVIQGPALMVKNAKSAGVEFRTRIPFTVISSRGNSVDAYTVSVNGHNALASEGEIELTSSDFEPNGQVSVSVSSTNYVASVRELSLSCLKENPRLEFVLEHEESSVLLRLNFSNGRVIEQRVAIAKSSPEYCQLKAGNFHGFRANKLAGRTAETYNVDLTVQSVPEAPKPTAAAAKKTAEPTIKIQEPKPVEKTTPANEPKPAVKTPTPAPIEFSNDEPDDNDTDTEEPRKRKSSRILTVLGIILALAVAAVLVWYLPKVVGINSSNHENNGMVISERVDTVAPETPAPKTDTVTSAPVEDLSAAPASQVINEDEAADLKYLNENGTWKRANLRSEKYQALYDAFTSGDIRAMAMNEYFATPGRATNTTAIKVMDAAWSSLGTGTAKANERELKKLKTAASIDLAKLYDSLARFRDKEPNTEPRPGKTNSK